MATAKKSRGRTLTSDIPPEYSDSVICRWSTGLPPGPERVTGSSAYSPAVSLVSTPAPGLTPFRCCLFIGTEYAGSVAALAAWIVCGKPYREKPGPPPVDPSGLVS